MHRIGLSAPSVAPHAASALAKRRNLLALGWSNPSWPPGSRCRFSRAGWAHASTPPPPPHSPPPQSTSPRSPRPLLPWTEAPSSAGSETGRRREMEIPRGLEPEGGGRGADAGGSVAGGGGSLADGGGSLTVPKEDCPVSCGPLPSDCGQGHATGGAAAVSEGNADGSEKVRNSVSAVSMGVHQRHRAPGLHGADCAFGAATKKEPIP